MRTLKRSLPSSRDSQPTKKVKLTLQRHKGDTFQTAHPPNHDNDGGLLCARSSKEQFPFRKSRYLKISCQHSDTYKVNMPSLKTNVNILRNGAQKRKLKGQDYDDDDDSDCLNPVRLQIRDHYDRFQQFSRRQYPKRKEDLFVDENVAVQAARADRDTALGIVDTLAREFITYWLPAVEVFLIEDSYDDLDLERIAYNRLANGLESGVLSVSARVDCSRNEAATELRARLQDHVDQCLSALFQACEAVLSEDERLKNVAKNKDVFSRKATTRNKESSNMVDDQVTEARLLNSTLVWSLAQPVSLSSELPPVSSLRKRRLSEPGTIDDADPMDNGRIWAAQGPEMHIHKFEIQVTNTTTITSSQKCTHKSSQARPNRVQDLADHIDLTIEDDSEEIQVKCSPVGISVEKEEYCEASANPPLKRQKIDESCIMM